MVCCLRQSPLCSTVTSLSLSQIFSRISHSFEYETPSEPHTWRHQSKNTWQEHFQFWLRIERNLLGRILWCTKDTCSASDLHETRTRHDDDTRCRCKDRPHLQERITTCTLVLTPSHIPLLTASSYEINSDVIAVFARDASQLALVVVSATVAAANKTQVLQGCKAQNVNIYILTYVHKHRI